MKRGDTIKYKQYEYSDERLGIYAHRSDGKDYIVIPSDEERFKKGLSYSIWIAGYSCESA